MVCNTLNIALYASPSKAVRRTVVVLAINLDRLVKQFLFLIFAGKLFKYLRIFYAIKN